MYPPQSYLMAMTHHVRRNSYKTSEVSRLAPETAATASSTTIVSLSIWPTQCRSRLAAGDGRSELHKVQIRKAELSSQVVRHDDVFFIVILRIGGTSA